jgi:hypothetical protein
MKQIQLQLKSNGKTLESVTLHPTLQLRLLAWAKINGGISLSKMIDLALRFTTAPEGREFDITLKAPEEPDIVALAARMLAKA